MELASVIIALIAAVAPAFVAMANHYNRAMALLDECLTLREYVAVGLAQCKCRDPQRIIRLLDSMPCHYLEREAKTIIPMAAIALYGVILTFMFYLAVEEAFWKLIFATSAASIPYLALFSIVRGMPAGLFAPARVFASRETC